mgnify:CR=1 FL=1
MNTRLAIISDLHIGAKAISQDLDNPRSAIPDFLEQFGDFVDKFKLAADALLVPGDLTSEAEPEQFRKANGAIREVASKLQIPDSRIAIIPGNHDVDWKVLKLRQNGRQRRKNPAPQIDPLRLKQRYDPLLLMDLFPKSNDSGFSGSLTTPPYVGHWTLGSLSVFGLNTAYHDGPEQCHFGQVDDTQISALRKMHASSAPSDLRILLLHHHPVQYRDPIQGAPDFSHLQNAESLHKLAAEIDIDVIVHGHKHSPRLQETRLSGNRPTCVIAAGSFCAELDTRWAACVSNQFHLLSIEGRDTRSGAVYGHLQSWAYVHARGWVESKEEHHGIHGVEGFGNDLHNNEIVTMAGTFILEQIAKCGWLKWSDIVRHQPRLRHLNVARRGEVVTQLCEKFGLDAHDGGDPIILQPKDPSESDAEEMPDGR